MVDDFAMRKLFVIICLLIGSTQLYAQKAYLELKKEIENWMNSVKSEVVVSSEHPQTIHYPNYDYEITGYFKKGVLQDGSWVDILCDKGSTKISGVYYRGTGGMCIKGIKEEISATTYGIFYVSNTANGLITNKTKSANNLIIVDRMMQFYAGSYGKCPVILSMNPSCLALDARTGQWDFLGFYATLNSDDIDKIGYKNLKELLLTVHSNCRMEYTQEHMFEGNMRLVLRDNGSIRFDRFEGEERNVPLGAKSMIVKRNHPYLHMIVENDTDKDIALQEWIVKEEVIPQDSLWNYELYYYNAEKVNFKYRNGNAYTGKCEVTKVETPEGYKYAVKITNGVYEFSSGEKFRGNLSGRYYAGIPIDGIMTFNDGKKADGTWIQEYELTQSQLDKLQKEYKYPTAIRDAAKKMEYSNKYIKYGHKNPEAQASICFFCPDNEHIMLRWPEYILYDKQTELYICKHKESPNATFVEFKTDKKGNHIMEIIYDNYDFKNSTKSVPKYINILTWYPNDEIKSIRTYHYSSEQLYLALNFFSDGTLKNAYLYGVGYDDKLVLRKSKESHPTLGGYTSRLYDLFGDYEKSISWSIGDVTWLLSVRKFDITDFKQVDF